MVIDSTCIQLDLITRKKHAEITIKKQIKSIKTMRMFYFYLKVIKK